MGGSTGNSGVDEVSDVDEDGGEDGGGTARLFFFFAVLLEPEAWVATRLTVGAEALKRWRKRKTIGSAQTRTYVSYWNVRITRATTSSNKNSLCTAFENVRSVYDDG